MSSLSRVIRFLFKFSRQLPHARLMFLLVVVLGMIGGAANTALIALINAKLQGDRGSYLLWGFAALCVGMPLARLLSNVVLLRLTQTASLSVRMELSRRIVRAPYAHLERLGPSRLLASLTEDVSTISTALIDVPLLTMQLTIVLGCVVYLGVLSWKGLLIVLGFMVVGIVTYQLPMSWADVHFRRSRGFGDVLYASLRALTEGIKELKLHWRRRRDFLSEGLEKASIDMQRESFLGSSISAGAASWGQILSFVLVGVVLFALPKLEGIDQRTLTGFALTILYMITPLEAVLNILPQFGRASVSVDRVEKLGLSLLEGAVQEAEVGVDPEPSWRRLELSGVTHSYRRDNQEDKFLLGPIHLDFSPGELVFVVGGNGSGKTTLAKLLIGLYAPEDGEVRLDGRAIDDESRDRYRQLFSVVFSDFFLFETLFGLRAPDLDAQAKHYIEALHLSSKVSVTGGALSTIELSQGQRKRLALLTAYLEDRPIYLFDEWAADQDPYFKEVFYLQLLPELRSRGKTVIVITHDDRYFHLADRLIKLDYGRVESDARQGATIDASKLREHDLASS